MQRLFSMFPVGQPGLALLLLRVALAILLVAGTSGALMGLGSTWYLLAPFSLAAALVVGFLSPVVCVLAILLEIATWLTSATPIEAPHYCAVLIAIALAMLGPGAYSIDARIFGRRQVVLTPLDRRNKD